MPRGLRALRPVRNRPSTHGARARWWTWHGGLHGQHGARAPHAFSRGSSSPTQKTGQRLRFRIIVTIAFESRAARPACASPRGEPTDRPRSTLALADLAWLSSRPTRGALHPAPLAEAPFHRHCDRSVAAATGLRGYSFRLPCRATRARFATWTTHQSPTEHTHAGGLGVVVFEANKGRAPPHAVSRGSFSPTLRQVGGYGTETPCP